VNEADESFQIVPAYGTEPKMVELSLSEYAPDESVTYLTVKWDLLTGDNNYVEQTTESKANELGRRDLIRNWYMTAQSATTSLKYPCLSGPVTT
jgi:hypothetical protein